MKAQDVMTSPPITVRPDTPVTEIASLLIERRISGVPVVDAAGRMVGIVSEGDLLRRCELGTDRQRSQWLELFVDRGLQAAEFVKANGMFARDVMTADVISVAPDADLVDIAALLERRRIKRVPVVRDGIPVGIVSRANVLHGLIASRRADSAAPAASDVELRRRIEERLAEEPWLDLSRINIVVSDRVAHLWGLVESEEQRRALKVAVQNITGVRDVVDHLTPDWFPNTAG
jgi:CBS domain-containing protein